jgi:hypothetical protein
MKPMIDEAQAELRRLEGNVMNLKNFQVSRIDSLFGLD